MNKDELKAAAKAAGLKVRENFTDDLPENLAILAVGMALGAVVAKLFF